MKEERVKLSRGEREWGMKKAGSNETDRHIQGDHIMKSQIHTSYMYQRLGLTWGLLLIPEIAMQNDTSKKKLTTECKTTCIKFQNP